jgi:hypothetical protein
MCRTPNQSQREIRTAACGSEEYEDCTTFLVGLMIRPTSRAR